MLMSLAMVLSLLPAAAMAAAVEETAPEDGIVDDVGGGVIPDEATDGGAAGSGEPEDGEPNDGEPEDGAPNGGEGENGEPAPDGEAGDGEGETEETPDGSGSDEGEKDGNEDALPEDENDVPDGATPDGDEVPDEDGVSEEELARIEEQWADFALWARMMPDGALVDSWEQDSQTVRGSDAVCEVKDGVLHLKVGSANGNNGDHWTSETEGTGPAVFVSDTMKDALQADTDGSYKVSFKMKPLVNGMCFGVYFNYKDPAHGALVGFNTPGGWFWQTYDGGTNAYSTTTLPGPTELTAGTTYQIEASWDPANKTATLRVDDAAVVTNWDYSAVPNAADVDVINNIGIKLGKSNTSVLSEIEVWDIHYTGQTEVEAYTLSGTVTDEDGEPVANASVAVSGDTYSDETTTNAQGVYSLELPDGSYTLTVSKEGYDEVTERIEVSGSNVPKDITLTTTKTVEIPSNGVFDTWTQLEASKKGNAVDPAEVDGKLVLQATPQNVNNLNADAPAVFTNATLNAALASTTGEKFLSFTVIPETVKENQVPDWVGFGIAIDYNDQVGAGANGYYIGYPAGQTTGWFVERLGGDGGYPGFTAPDVVPGEPLKVEIRWTANKVTLKLNDVSYDLPDNGSQKDVPVTNKIGIKLGSNTYNGTELQGSRTTKLTLSDIHYSGQETVTGHYVRGVVRDNSGRVLAGATVTASDGTTATADNNGAYSMVLAESNEVYTLTASMDGYGDGTAEVTVNKDSAEEDLENVSFNLELLPVLTGKVTEKGTAKAVKGASVALYKAGAEEEAEPFKTAVSGEDGTYRIIGVPSGDYTLKVSCEGYTEATVETVTVGSEDAVQNVELEVYTVPFYTLSTASMDVMVDQTFPRVIKYVMKGELAGEELWGQSAILDTIKINGTDVKPTVTSEVVGSEKAVYTMVIDSNNNNGTGVTATITAELRVGLDGLNDPGSDAADRTLGFYITDVTYPNNNDKLANPVETIEIPNHSLVSVRSTEPGAAVTGGKQAANTTESGDVSYPAAGNENFAGYTEDFFAAFVYNDSLSASLASNSAYAARGTAGDQCYPVRAQFDAKDGGSSVAIGLGSTLWYYHYDISKSEGGGLKALTEDQLPRAKRIMEPLETPFAKVVITGDMNGNREVDWQDAAIAYRETVMHIPAGGEGVADSVNLRISMNFGSMATNPFLIALDNVKRVAAHTDGLGQFVLLKGYAGEGHDSNHPQYDNIGVRMGGAEDMVTLMREGGELGAVFGIHTNASEFYAEAIEEENQVLRYSAGGMKYGWNWLDQGISINAVYDYAMGLRKTRWDKLYDIVQGYPFVVYVDVWGNNTSGTEDAFQTRALSEEIISHDGWRIAHEWAWANPYESTFQHWTTDFTYGDYSQKGKLSGNVLRFILNQYKDSFPPDFASYGGSANAPLLGGPAMQGFEGWQGDGEYSLSIYNTYNQMIYTKFLQHYPVVEWINADAPVVIPYNGGGAGGSRSNSTTSSWTPETQIRLSDGADEIVVTRGTSGRVVTDFGMDTVDKFLEGETEYRSRVVTLNGKVIAEGAPASAGEDNTFPKEKATLRYLIPWYWDNEGERVAPADEKLYHWNATSEATEWELPDGWENLSSVMIYELSDQGRGAGRRVSVSNGWITLSGIKPNTGYVVTKDAGSAPAPQINYGTDLYLEDPSFNLDTAKGPWTVSGSGSAVRTTNTEGISVLKMIGAVSVSQKLSGLQAGKVYAMYAAVDNRSNAKAVMTITDSSGKVVATNYTERSIARNYISSYYLHNGHGMEAGTSFFQNMFLYFTPQAGETYTLTLSRTAGSGSVYFDDIRTVEYRGSESPVVYNPETGAATELHQDFENVPQGIWPFVVGPVENVADNRTHLSELNGEFTQAGWDVKKMDDVIDGNWSIKSNGLHGRNNLVYQTIPQNFRFEPDKVYTVSFDYELGSAGSYVAVVGDGAYAGLGSLTVHNLEQTLKTTVPGNSGVAGNDTAKAKVGHIEFTVVGSKSGQTWVGIYSKENANSQGTSGSEAAFGGYLDFVLDNLSIELAAPEKTELALLLQEADAMVEEVYNETTAGDWEAFVQARTNGHTVFDNENASTAQVADAVDALKTAMAKLTKAVISISGTVTNTLDAAVEGAVLTLEDSRYFPTGLTVTTGADGTFQFVSKSGVELLPGTYHIKVEATGYYVTTTGDIVVTKADGVKTQDIQLEAEAPGAYVNDFNGGDISMMGPVVDGPANELPTTEWVEYNGSGALKVIWNGLGGQAARPINNVVDKTISFANGTFSFDVTALTTGARFNVTMRTTSGSNRLTVGQEDSPNRWFCEYWAESGGSSYTGVQDNSGKPYIEPGATRNVRVTLNDYDVTVYIDGMAVYTNNLQNISAITTPGWCGINMSGNQGSEFILDNIRIIRADPADGVQNVTGTITARSGVAVSGAAVELYKDGARVAGTATNALGQYQVSRVEPGAYTLKVSAPFFKSQEKSITVTDSSDLTDQDFTLIPDISSLTALIEQVEALKEEDYTEESWAVLAEALAEAKKIDGASSVAALNTAYRNLSNARDALEAKEADAVDYSALRELYNEMALVENEGYTASAWENFQAALGIALEVLSSETTQKQVDLARDGLQSAYDSLELEYVAPDLSALRAAYAAAEGVTNENYTEESWTAFETARALAKRILDSDGLGYTQEAVDEAAGDLIAAQEALVKNSGGDNPGGDGDNPGGDGDNPGGDGDNPGGDGDNPGGDNDNSGSNGGSTGGSSGGGGSSKPDAPSTSTTENPDGSITTVVTDTKTGTVTTTTEWPDGRKEVIVVQADGTVTQTKTDAEGGQAEKVTDPEKNVTITVTDPAGETLVRADIPAQLPTPEQRFADVPGGHWADDAIHQMAGLGLVNGVGGNRFNHQGDMKRGDLAVILARLSNGAEDYPLTFTDVPAGKYYAGSIAWAAKTGVVTGRSDELFMPEDTITRAELAVMLYRYAKLLKLDTAVSGSELNGFADSGSVADWAAEGMSWCVKNRILQGKNGGILDPRTNVTRAEVSVMLQRFINLMK